MPSEGIAGHAAVDRHQHRHQRRDERARRRPRRSCARPMSRCTWPRARARPGTASSTRTRTTSWSAPWASRQTSSARSASTSSSSTTSRSSTSPRGELAGVEALVRWRHPTRGLLQPRDFIHLAELTGAIGPLDRWVLEEAGRQAAAWGADGPTGGGRFLSVNLSPAGARAARASVTLVRDVLRRLGPARRAAAARGDRDGASPTRAAWRPPRRAQGAGGAPGDRRLRHRLRIFQPAARQPVRRHQDRREPVHAMGSDPRAGAIVERDHRPRPAARRRSTIAEGIEGASSSPSCASSAATSARASTSPRPAARRARGAARPFRLPGRAPAPHRSPPRTRRLGVCEGLLSVGRRLPAAAASSARSDRPLRTVTSLPSGPE